jgi:hypothetical protein
MFGPAAGMVAVVAAHDLVAAEAAVRGRILRAEPLVVRDPAVALAARGPVAGVK